MQSRLASYFPILGWLRAYDLTMLTDDALAAIIVKTSPHILSLRVDESLYFANARYLEDKIYDIAAQRPELRHVVLMCSAVHEIDASALESLEAINQRLKARGIFFHLSEVKGPLMDQLKRTEFLNLLTGQVFLSQYSAIEALDPDLWREAKPSSQRRRG